MPKEEDAAYLLETVKWRDLELETVKGRDCLLETEKGRDCL
jgi:hypothetical protein